MLDETQPSQKYNRSGKLKPILLPATILLLIILTFVGVINYFKLLPQSSTINKLGSPTPTIDRKTLPFLACPLSNQDCAKGKLIKTNDKGVTTYAIQFDNISADSIILSAIAGKETKESANKISILSADRGIKVEYIFSGKFLLNIGTLPTSVAESQSIGIFAQDTNNSLTLSATATVTEQSLPLGVGPNGSYLTNQE